MLGVNPGGGPKTLSWLWALGSFDGDEWDTVNLDVNIPGNADSLTIQAFSRDDLCVG